MLVPLPSASGHSKPEAPSQAIARASGALGALHLTCLVSLTGCVAIERTNEPGTDLQIEVADRDVALEVQDLPVATDADTDGPLATFCSTSGQLKCIGASVHECVDNAWKARLDCGDGYVCEGTSCVCVKTCGSSVCGVDGCGAPCGICVDGDECQAGQCVTLCKPDCTDRACGDNGCGASCGTCDNTLACEAATGQCVQSATCQEMLECQSECVRVGGELVACGESCLQQASTYVASEFNVVAACIEGTDCATLDCVGKECGAQYANCYFDAVGDSSCQKAAACVSDCDDTAPPAAQDACFFACLEGSTQAAQLAWIQVSLCLGTYCELPADPLCTQEAAAGPCSVPYDACFGSP